MISLKKFKPLAHALIATLIYAPLYSMAEDIDIFVGSSSGAAQNPKILIVLDNTSNWARQSQQWPGGIQQGQSEARAIRTVINSSFIDDKVNLGLMEFVTGGNANDNGGFVRQAIVPMDSTNKSAFSTKLDTIYNGVNDPDEKRNSNTEYGNLMYDVYNYFSGGTSYSPGGVLSSIADPNGYTSLYSRFRSPLSDANACGRNFLIFIGNPNSSGPASDSTANGNTLVGLGGTISPQIKLQNYNTVVTPSYTNLGYTSQCYASAGSCSTADYASQCAVGAGFDSCVCGAPTSTGAVQVPVTGGLSYYTAYGQGTRTVVTTNSAPSTSCYTSQSAADAAFKAGTDRGGLTCPAGSSCDWAAGAVGAACSGTTNTTSGTTNSCYSSQPTVAQVTTDHGGLTCPSGSTCSYAPGAATGSACAASNIVTTGVTTSCYANSTPPISSQLNTDHGSLVCPSGYTCSYTAGTTSSACTSTVTGTTLSCYANANSAAGDNGGLTCPSGNTCTYAIGAQGSSNGCGNNKNYFAVIQTITPNPPTSRYNFTQTAVPATTYRYTVTQNATSSTNPSKYTVMQTINTVTPAAAAPGAVVGVTTGTYASATAAQASEFVSQCAQYSGGCTFVSTSNTTTAAACTTGAHYTVQGVRNSTTYTSTGTTTVPTSNVYADEWSRLLHEPILTPSGTTIPQSITTYTIDVYNAQQNIEHTKLLQSMAAVGGGRYFAAKNEAEIVTALQTILAEIQSVNTTFASASLPVNATNRGQNVNQVFIGQFRPDPDAKPRWFGNLKQYKVGLVNGALDLVDRSGISAVNSQTGFISDCAVSQWTSDSGSYWSSLATAINPPPKSKCPTAADPYSDLPDGPTVEKGAVAEVIRRGNNPSSPTNTLNRNILTGTSSTLVAFDTSSSGLSASLVNFTRGLDINNETGNGGASATVPRASIHGDVVHSRPLAVNYGGTRGVTVYYGANDGTYRAVDAGVDGSPSGNEGRERWAYIAPEHYGKLARLQANSPLVNYPSVNASLGPQKRDYFFDGSSGIYQTANSLTTWIFPTQRRGGRMVYAFDVSDPTVNPTLKWRRGCPNLSDDSGCIGGGDIAEMGQTWSTPAVALVKGYSTGSRPVVIVGGGYDDCEDADNSSPSCTNGKGHRVFVFDADNGNLLRSFTTTRSVVSEPALLDVDADGFIDFAYFSDTGGNLYRLDFSMPGPAYTSLSNSDWVLHRVAYTNGAGRKFHYAPAVFQNGKYTYLAVASGDRERPLITNYPYTTPVLNRGYVYRDNLYDPVNTPAYDLDSLTDNNSNATGTSCTVSSLLALAESETFKGWYINLSGRGEQGVTTAVIVGSVVFFSTNRPIDSAQSCGTILGEARGYALNLFNGSGAIGAPSNGVCGGTRFTTFAGGGIPPSPIVANVKVNGKQETVLFGAVDRSAIPGVSVSPIAPARATISVPKNRSRTYKYIQSDN